MPDVTKVITDLVEYLNVCRDEYYNNNNSIITDKQYDDLFDRLEHLEKTTGIILTNSPTQNVGYEVKSELTKVEHAYPLLSLDKTQSYKDMLDFCKDNKMLFMYKVDGLTCQLTYKDGKLFRAETRGDGYIGEDITHNALTFIGVPKTIPYEGIIHITGEAVINRRDFIKVNESLDDVYKNPRNLASGSVRQLDSSICAKRKVRFIVWNANDLSTNDSMLDGLFRAQNAGFTIVHQYTLLSVKEEAQLETLFNNMKNHTKQDYIPIDGIVAMYDSISYGKSLGKTEHHFKNGLAFKFYNDSYETTLNTIEFTIGKTGVLTPTAVFDPVDIDGTTITRASVHNISILKQLNLCKDDVIEIYKANEIIPQIRLNKTKHILSNECMSMIPDKCPYCNSATTIITDYDSNVDRLFCTNRKCRGILLKKLSAFVSKDAMDIDGLSEKTLDKFIELGFINEYKDIYHLYEYKDKMYQLDGFGHKSVDTILDSIEQSKNTTLDRLLYAVNIDGIGKKVSKDLSKLFNNDYTKLLEFRLSSDRGMRLLSINGFGSVLSSSFLDWLDHNYSEFEELCSYMNFKNKEQNQSNKLNNMIFVITGKLNRFANRDELVNLITFNGGAVTTSVSKETTYLINNDIDSNSSKNKKAKELGIKIISEDFLIDMLEAAPASDDSDMKPTIVKQDTKLKRKKLF
jgi:DNA ligase (NAD+)